MPTYGQLQRAIRERQRLYLGHLSDALNCTAAYISDIELGRKKPPAADVVEKIATRLEATDDERAELLRLAKIERSKFTFKSIGQREEATEFMEVLARAWNLNSLSDEQVRQMKEILQKKEE